MNEQEVEEFLWSHLQSDLATLGNATNKSPDDCVILLHHVIDTIARSKEGISIDCAVTNFQVSL